MENANNFSPNIKKYSSIIGIVLLVAIVIFSLFNEPKQITVAVNSDNLSCSYASEEPFVIQFEDILFITIIENFKIGDIISGIQTRRYNYGIWENNMFGKYQLCSDIKLTHYIIVETKDDVLVMNFESDDATDSFYKAFIELLNTK